MFDCELEDHDLKDITLNGKHFKQIVNTHLKQMIIDHLFQTYNIRMNCTNKYFRAFNSLTDINILKSHKHLAYINTNQRICLIALVQFKHKNVCLLIDKQHSLFYLLKCQFSQSLYQGTIFEGEMIDSYFMISDFLVYLQKNIALHVLDRRMTLLNSIISMKNYHYDQLLDPFQIIVKDFVEYSQLLSYIHDYLPKTAYKDRVSGLVFRPIENCNKNLIYNFQTAKQFNCDPIKSILAPLEQSEQTTQNTQSTQITQSTQSHDHKEKKIDVQNHPEVKFLLFETGNPDDYCLKLLSSDGQLFEYDYALINDMKTSQYFQKLIDTTPETIKKNGFCVTCRYLPNFKKWKPLQIIEDHQQPDNITNLT